MDIKHDTAWQFILSQPGTYFGKKSLYGLQCFITGLTFAKSDVFYTDKGEEFNLWLSKKLNVYIANSFHYALLEAEDDDEKAYDLWTLWFVSYKGHKDAEKDLTTPLEINSEFDREVMTNWVSWV